MNMDFIISNDRKLKVDPSKYKTINLINSSVFINKSQCQEIEYQNKLYFIFGNINGYYDDKLNLKKIKKNF